MSEQCPVCGRFLPYVIDLEQCTYNQLLNASCLWLTSYTAKVVRKARQGKLTPYDMQAIPHNHRSAAVKALIKRRANAITENEP